MPGEFGLQSLAHGQFNRGRFNHVAALPTLNPDVVRSPRYTALLDLHPKKQTFRHDARDHFARRIPETRFLLRCSDLAPFRSKGSRVLYR